MKLRRGGHGVRLRVLQVGAGREGAAALVAGEDGAADLVVVLHGVEVARQPLVEVRAPRVAGRGPAQRDDADVIALLVHDGHVGVLSGRRAVGSVHRAGGLAGGAADPDPPRHAHALDVGGAAGMHGHDAVALLEPSMNPSCEPQVGSLVSAAGPTASRMAPVIQRPVILR